jgi:hypothetical protein
MLAEEAIQLASVLQAVSQVLAANADAVIREDII